MFWVQYSSNWESGSFRYDDSHDNSILGSPDYILFWKTVIMDCYHGTMNLIFPVFAILLKISIIDGKIELIFLANCLGTATIDPPTIDPPTIDPPTIDPPTIDPLCNYTGALITEGGGGG